MTGSGNPTSATDVTSVSAAQRVARMGALGNGRYLHETHVVFDDSAVVAAVGIAASTVVEAL